MSGFFQFVCAFVIGFFGLASAAVSEQRNHDGYFWFGVLLLLAALILAAGV